MELETAAEQAMHRDDPLARLEHGLEDKRRAKETRGRLLELRADAEAKYADDYAINKALRAKNRCAAGDASHSRSVLRIASELWANSWKANPCAQCRYDAEAVTASAWPNQPRETRLSSTCPALMLSSLLNDPEGMLGLKVQRLQVQEEGGAAARHAAAGAGPARHGAAAAGAPGGRAGRSAGHLRRRPGVRQGPPGLHDQPS